MRSLQTPQQAISLTTFRVDRAGYEELRELVRVAYRNEVERRNGDPVITPDLERKISTVAKWLIDGKKPGLMLFGSIGSGKTTLARAIMRTINYLYYSVYRDQRKEIAEISALNLTKLIATGEKPDEESFLRFQKREMVFIDDLGLEPAAIKNYGNEILPVVDLLYYRHDRMLFTICTSNLDMNDFEQKYGQRTASRFYEMFNRIGFTNEDYRKR
ncbi:MAG: AAA family ATPase [Bacteroidales bacterium]|nr:AAA family ATPase [Bacteroidales bacterium]